MTSFADRMNGFTNHLQSSIQERGDALTRVHGATNLLLDGARKFMSDVAHDHQAMASELRATLDTQRRAVRAHHRAAAHSSRVAPADADRSAPDAGREQSEPPGGPAPTAQHVPPGSARAGRRPQQGVACLARIRCGTLLSQTSRLDFARRPQGRAKSRLGGPDGGSGGREGRTSDGSPARRSHCGPAVPDHSPRARAARARPQLRNTSLPTRRQGE